MEELIKSAIINHGDKNIFDVLQDSIENYHERPTQNLVELRQINTKAKGDVFEKLCKKYLQIVYQCEQVYLLKELPENLRTYLNLNKNDYGIDIVVIKNNLFYPEIGRAHV